MSEMKESRSWKSSQEQRPEETLLPFTHMYTAIVWSWVGPPQSFVAWASARSGLSLWSVDASFWRKVSKDRTKNLRPQSADFCSILPCPRLEATICLLYIVRSAEGEKLKGKRKEHGVVSALGNEAYHNVDRLRCFTCWSQVSNPISGRCSLRVGRSSVFIWPQKGSNFSAHSSLPAFPKWQPCTRDLRVERVPRFID